MSFVSSAPEHLGYYDLQLDRKENATGIPDGAEMVTRKMKMKGAAAGTPV